MRFPMNTIGVGTRLGPYEILAPIGAGGMGEVWRGRDTRLDRSVAIKVLPAEFAQNAQLKLRFEREARAISQLNHPNICTLYDVGDSYLVMELLEGESLAERLGRGPMPLADVLKYGAQIAEALDRAHRAGIVHRDLKPGNIMITKSGAKLLDFGLAKSGVGVVSVEGATEHKALTQEGTILGTFQYMAPEQLEGEEADARTDIFALGAVLYEMTTGKRAFEGKTRTSLIAAIVQSDPPPISMVQPLTPPIFEHVIRKCLCKDREDRWQSAHDVAEELKWIAAAGSQAGVPVSRTIRRKTREGLAWTAVAVLALAAGAFATHAFHLRQAPPAYRFAIPMIDNGYKFGASPQLSLDGRTLFFRALNDAGKSQVFRRRLDELNVHAIEGTDGAFAYTVSPDGRNLILQHSGAIIKRVSVDGGPAQLLTDAAVGGGSVAANAEGTVLIGFGLFPIRRILPDGRLEEVTHLDKARGEVSHEFPRFLPDGKRFLFIAVTRDPARGTVHRLLCAASLDSKEVTRIVEVPTEVACAVRHLFFVREGTLMAQPFDESRLKVAGDAFAVADGVAFSSRFGTASFSVATDGTIVYSSPSGSNRVTWVDASGKKLGNAGSLAPIVRGSWAIFPGGDRVIVSVMNQKEGTPALWVQGVTRDTATRVTFSVAAEVSPLITPDGTQVLFGADPAGGTHIYASPVDGSTPPALVVSAANNQLPSDISPDGRWLFYQSNQNQAATKQDLWVLSLTGESKPRPFVATPAIETSGAFSPDGKWVAYVSDASGTPQIYVRPFPGPGAARPVSTKGGTSPRFSRDGHLIYFADAQKFMSAEFHPDGTVAEPAVKFELDQRIQSFREMPAGDRFLMVLQNDTEASPPLQVITGWRPPG
jgi:Tol biopolymer transport system component